MVLFRLLFATLLFAFGALAPCIADVASEQEGRYRRLPPGKEVSPQRALEGMALALGKSNPAGFAEQVQVIDHPQCSNRNNIKLRYLALLTISSLTGPQF